jgi:DNA-directed RNA polymerase subunit RPC12/RpoP
MVGVQCKSCGHRALFKQELKPGRPFKMDSEVVSELTRSNPKCSQCGRSEYSITTLSSNLAHLWDRWLTGDASPPPAKPLIEGDKQD